MYFQKRSYRIFVVTLTVLVMMLLGISTVLAASSESRNIKPASFEVELKLDKKGSVVPSTGVATVKGSVICSEPARVSIWGELERRLGRVTVRGNFYSYFRCDGKTPWKAKVVSQTGPFVGGKAKVRANAYAYTDYEIDSDHAERTIILKGSPPPKPYYSSMLESPEASTTVLTFGILSLGLVAGLVLVIGSPTNLKRFWER